MKQKLSSLLGWHVVILRPRAQAQTFISAVQDLQATPLVLPTLEIIPLEISAQQTQSWLNLLDKAVVVIVASANAIHCAPKLLLIALAKQGTPREIITMGRATSQALQDQHIKDVITPVPGSTSETLLGYPQLQAQRVSGKTVILLSGEGGRTLIHDNLLARGANVETIAVYRQRCPSTNIDGALTEYQQLPKCCFIATSSNMLENLIQLTAPEHKEWLLACPMIVVSERTAQHASAWGVKQVFVSLSAHPEDIQVALQKMAQVCDTIH